MLLTLIERALEMDSTQKNGMRHFVNKIKIHYLKYRKSINSFIQKNYPNLQKKNIIKFMVRTDNDDKLSER